MAAVEATDCAMEGTVNWAKREDTRGLTRGTTTGGTTLGADAGTADTDEAGVVFAGVTGWGEVLATVLTVEASGFSAFDVGCFATVAFFATGLARACGLAAAGVLTVALAGVLSVGLAAIAGLPLVEVFVTAFVAVGFAAGLAFTAGLASPFTTGFLAVTALDDFTAALPAAGLATDLATALLAGLVLTLDLVATVLALVDTASFLF